MNVNFIFMSNAQNEQTIAWKQRKKIFQIIKKKYLKYSVKATDHLK